MFPMCSRVVQEHHQSSWHIRNTGMSTISYCSERVMPQDKNQGVWVIFGPLGQEVTRFKSQLQANAYAELIGGTVRYVGR